MTSRKKFSVKAALTFEKNDGVVVKCGLLVLKGKDGAYSKIQKKISQKAGIDKSQIKIFFVKNDNSCVSISNEKELNELAVDLEGTKNCTIVGKMDNKEWIVTLTVGDENEEKQESNSFYLVFSKKEEIDYQSVLSCVYNKLCLKANEDDVKLKMENTSNFVTNTASLVSLFDTTTQECKLGVTVTTLDVPKFYILVKLSTNEKSFKWQPSHLQTSGWVADDNDGDNDGDNDDEESISIDWESEHKQLISRIRTEFGINLKDSFKIVQVTDIEGQNGADEEQDDNDEVDPDALEYVWSEVNEKYEEITDDYSNNSECEEAFVTLEVRLINDSGGVVEMSNSCDITENKNGNEDENDVSIRTDNSREGRLNSKAQPSQVAQVKMLVSRLGDDSTTFESWLKDCRLTKIQEKIMDAGIESLEDIQMLETKKDIQDLCVDMKLNPVFTKKFVKAVMKLSNITDVAVMAQPAQPESQSTAQPAQAPQNYDEKEIKEDEEAIKAKRKVFNLKGVHPVEKLCQLRTDKRHRTIMVIGATGTGKTTLLNSMMNYLYQVEYDDPYRFKLIYEQLKAHGQAESVTDEVTAYHLDPPALKYQLTVIDTPGYGDTRGLSHDQKITKNIKNFFETKIQEIDAICFVIRAPQARLTATQKYIFAQVLGIFGKNIATNILVLMTFADGKKPPALAALKAGNVPFGQHFKLNNSGFDLPDENEEPDMVSQMFWKMGITSFDNLFKAIDKLKTKSLTLTKKVLTRREQLENYVVAIQPTIRVGFTVLEKLRNQIVIIQKFGDMINANKDFTYPEKVTEARKVPIDDGTNTTTCLNCNTTCHLGCAYSDNKEKKDCCAITGENCTVCRNKCHWTLHKNEPHQWVWYETTVQRTYDDLKSKYVDASNQKSAKEQMMAGTFAELEDVEIDLKSLIGNVKDCLNELSEIALRPNVLSQDDYIEKLIQSEEDEKKPGWQKRIGALKDLKEKRDVINQVNNDAYDPWKQYNDVMKFVQKNDNVTQQAKNKRKGNGSYKGWFTGLFGK